jgi:hypothetical protein
MRFRLGLGSFPILQIACCVGTRRKKKLHRDHYQAARLFFLFWNHFLHSRPQSKEAAERLPSYTKLEEASARNRLPFFSK